MRIGIRGVAVLALGLGASACALPFLRQREPAVPPPVASSGPAPRNSPVAPGARVAPTITCPIWVRPTDTVVPRRAQTLVLRDWGDHQEFHYRTLHVAVEMSFDPYEPDMYVSTGGRTSTTSTTYVWTSDRGPGNPFGATKQGFTGLVYVHGPGDDPIEIQLICRSSG